MKINQVDEKWSEKYKRSIDCDNPKGFSQRAHCDGRKKKTEGKGYHKSVITPHQNLPSTNTPFGGTTMVGKGFRDLEKAQAKTQTAVDQRQGAGMSRIGVFKNIDNTDFSPEVFPRRTTPKKSRVSELKIQKPDSSSTKGIKRADMPQIANKDYPEFIDYLQDNGAEFTKQTMPAKALKATQGEFSDKGVLKQIQKYIDGAPKKPVIASSDNFIIDGHHRWLVAWNTGDTVEVYKVNMEADELIKLVLKFPKVTFKDIYTEELYDFDKEQPMKSTVAVPGYGTMSIDGLMKNLVQSVTELLGRMKQGTDGMRFADYELNRNKVLTTKLGALIKALDDLQAIRKQGGARSRNIQREAEQQELPIDVNKIFDNIQEFESRQYITPQDADKMRRGVQSLTSGRQTINSEAILQLLTMVTR